jgi:hypothetical protein
VALANHLYTELQYSALKLLFNEYFLDKDLKMVQFYLKLSGTNCKQNGVKHLKK